MRCRALTNLLLTSISFFLLTGCVCRHNVHDSGSPHIKSDDVREQVMLLASKVGIPDDKIKKSSTKEILVDIELKLNEHHKYNGKILTAEEMDILSNYLNDQRHILRIIRNYHHYIQVVQDKKFIVLPESNQ